MRNYTLPNSTMIVGRGMTVQTMTVGSSLLIKRVEVLDLYPELLGTNNRHVLLEHATLKFTPPTEGTTPFPANLGNVFTAQVFGTNLAGFTVPLTTAVVLSKVNPVTLNLRIPEWFLGPVPVSSSGQIFFEIWWRASANMSTGGVNLGAEITSRARITNAEVNNF